MGRILVVEADRNFQSWIEKVFPKEKLKVFEADFPKADSGGGAAEEEKKRASVASGEEGLRDFIREEARRNPGGTLHETVIGKIERALIGLILEEEKGNRMRAAKRLGINRNTLRKKMKDLQIATRVVAGFAENRGGGSPPPR
jgi:two-component system, NtrC family, nitrogen regulation response regulator GlnG